MAVKVLATNTEPLPPPPNPQKAVGRYVFQLRDRLLISCAAFMLHAGSFLYLICLAVVYYGLPDDQIQILHTFLPRVNSGIFVILACLNLRGMYWILYPRAINTSVLVYDPNANPSTFPDKVWHLYVRCFSRYGLFGLHGELYDVRVAAKHVVQVISQVVQAHEMSLYLTQPTASAAYTVILGFGCVIMPLFLFSSNPLVNRWGSTITDAFLNFFLCAGFALMLLFRAITDYYFSGNDDFLWNRVWLNQMIMLARAVSIKSPLELLSTVFLFVSCFISLKNLHAAVHAKVKDVDSTHTSTHLSILALGKITNKEQIITITRRTLLGVSAAASALIFALAATSVHREACPPGCLLQTYPWFSQTCNCVMMRQNCLLHPIPNNDVDNFITTRLSNVFDMTVSQCELPQGLAASTLQRLNNLYSLTFRRTNTVVWNAQPSDVPDSQFVLYLIDQVMPAVPTILQANSKGLKFILLRNITLTRNLTIPPLAGLFQIDLTNMTLDVVPPFLLASDILTDVSLDYNHIQEIPMEIISMTSLQALYLTFNAITTIPSALTTTFPPTLKTLALGGNPIDTLPTDFDFELLQSRRITIDGTPLCLRILKAVAANEADKLSQLEQQIASHIKTICQFDCAVGCTSKRLGNTQCDPVCMTRACNFDSSAAQFAARGVEASDCYGEITGWESTVS
ncbi:unnamed protein product [Aphanomyces euteiches]